MTNFKHGGIFVEGSTLRRARRTARAVPDGPAILEYLSGSETRKSLVAAAEAGHPPVAAVSRELVEMIGQQKASLTNVKQFVGLCIRAVLEEEGFSVEGAGVRLSHDAVFKTGSVYRRKEYKDTAPTNGLLIRFLDSLNDEEAASALSHLNNRMRLSSN